MNTRLDISNFTIAGYAQDIALRSYLPVGGNGLPVVLYFHGGGFVGGCLDDAAIAAEWLASRIPAWVLAVGYSLAPAFPFPGAIEDAYLAFEWASRNAQRYRADATRIAVAGHDAGGNLAASLVAVARDRGSHRPAAQILFAPLLDPSMTRVLEADCRSNPAFDAQACARFYRAYLPQASQRIHPYAAPLESRRLATLPPALIACAENDPVRADGEHYANALIAAGVPVDITRHGSVGHHELAAHAPVLRDAVQFARKWLAAG